MSSPASDVAKLLISGVVHAHNTAKPNSQPNTTPTAQNLKNANSSSPTSNPAHLHPLPPTVVETTPSLQKAKSSHKLPPT